MLAKIATLLPTHTRRSEESEALQQFSTPVSGVPVKQPLRTPIIAVFAYVMASAMGAKERTICLKLCDEYNEKYSII